MRILKWLIGIIVVLAVIFVAGAYLLPREITVERTQRIDAPADAIFPHLNALRMGEAWSPWLGRDPDVQLTYEGPEEGVGNKMSWASDHPQVGNGSQVIVTSTPSELIEFDLDFGDMGVARAWFTLSEDSGATDVTWGLRTDMGNSPVGRWMGLMMDRWVGADYEAGLGNLKELVEAG